MEQNKQTPIELWVKENNYHDNQYGLKEKCHAFRLGCDRLLTYLGLQDQPDPKKWVEEMKYLDQSELAENQRKQKDLLTYAKIDQLQAENETLKRANDDMDVTILNYQLDTIPTLIKENERLKQTIEALSKGGK